VEGDNVPFLYIDMITTLLYWYIEGTFVVEVWWRVEGDNVPFLYIDMITTLSYWYIEGDIM